MNRKLSQLRARLGALGWGALLAFVILRANDFAGIVFRVITGRFLSPDEFGAFGAAFSFVVLFTLPALIIFQSVTKAVSRIQSQDDQMAMNALVRDLVVCAVIMTLVLCGLFTVLRGAICERLKIGEGYAPMLLLLVTTGLWCAMLLAVFQGSRNYRMLGIQSVISAALVLLSVIVFVWRYKQGLPGALISKAIAGIGLIVSGMIPLLPCLLGKKRRSVVEYGVMRRTFLPILVYGITANSLLHFDRLFVRNFAMSDSGAYEAVATLGSIPGFFIGSIVFVIFPLASYEHAAGRDVMKYLRQAMLLGLGITAASFLVFLLVAGPVFTLWKPEYSEAAWACAVYGLATGVNGIVQMISSIELARNRYGFLASIFLPCALSFALIYMARASVSLSMMVWCLLGANLLVCVSLIIHIYVAERLAARD